MLKFCSDNSHHFIADNLLTPLETLTKVPSSEASLLIKDEKGQNLTLEVKHVTTNVLLQVSAGSFHAVVREQQELQSSLERCVGAADQLRPEDQPEEDGSRANKKLFTKKPRFEVYRLQKTCPNT